jgi:hypothetical protein
MQNTTFISLVAVAVLIRIILFGWDFQSILGSRKEIVTPVTDFKRSKCLRTVDAYALQYEKEYGYWKEEKVFIEEMLIINRLS